MHPDTTSVLAAPKAEDLYASVSFTDEMMVADERAGLTPADMVERKLLSLLQPDRRAVRPLPRGCHRSLVD
ncbi:MAG TPA: hypothetical protein VG013_38385 [Gemmataceae bacterium]|nr:hypothetical protein [Gemmataceae bacterium]